MIIAHGQIAKLISRLAESQALAEAIQSGSELFGWTAEADAEV